MKAILLLLACAAHALYADQLVVSTSNGQVRGTTVEFNGQSVNAWLGIPFAEKPIGNLRFKKPQTVSNWQGVLDTRQLPNSCYQFPSFEVETGVNWQDMWTMGTPMSEDCLYLNIWAPRSTPSNASVVVWIHGGGYGFGTPNYKVTDPTILVAETGIIAVTIQYRLNIFGFLYLNSTDAPGNQGLLDQNMALQWVYNNIGNFGGDRNKITIMGESAGAMSVANHLISPLSWPYFNQAIMQSGSSLSSAFTLTPSQALARYVNIVNGIGCPSSDPNSLINCLRQISPGTLNSAATGYFIQTSTANSFSPPTYLTIFAFVPVIDGYFFPDSPRNLLDKGLFKKASILLGANMNEGNIFISLPAYANYSVEPIVSDSLLKEYINLTFQYKMPYTGETFSADQVNAIIKKYSACANKPELNAFNLDQAVGTPQFTCPVVEFANYYARSGAYVYLYYFTWISPTRGYYPHWFGSTHSSEIAYTFGQPLNSSYGYPANEVAFAKKLVNYWANFVKYGNPNGVDSFFGSIIKEVWSFFTNIFSVSTTTWPQHRASGLNKRAFMVLDADKAYVSDNLDSDQCTFWKTILS